MRWRESREASETDAQRFLGSKGAIPEVVPYPCPAILLMILSDPARSAHLGQVGREATAQVWAPNLLSAEERQFATAFGAKWGLRQTSSPV